MIQPRTNTLSIRTPEGIVFALPLAGPATRFLAWGVDFGVTLVAMSLIMTAFAVLRVLSPDFGAAISMLTYFALMIGYGILFEWFWRGQTLGKFIMGIRVMDVQGLQLQFSQVAIRNLLRFVDSMPVLYFLGGSAMLLSRRAQRLGDFAANTVVVRARVARQPDFQQIMPEKYNSFRAYPHIEARLRQRVSAEEAAILVQSLLRREELDAEARVALYTEIAGHFQRLMPFPPEATLGLTSEQYLRNLAESLFRNRA